MYLRQRSITFLLGVTFLILAPTMSRTTEAQEAFNPLNFAQQAGAAAGSLYCKATPFQKAVEEGITIALIKSGIPMNELDEKVDFDSDAISQTMIIGMIDHTIDHCPQRAKQIFRDFSSMSP